MKPEGKKKKKLVSRKKQKVRIPCHNLAFHFKRESGNNHDNNIKGRYLKKKKKREKKKKKQTQREGIYEPTKNKKRK